MMKVFKWGVLGCGRIAETFARSMTACSGGRIEAGASRTAGKAEKFCRRYDIPKSCSSVRGMRNPGALIMRRVKISAPRSMPYTATWRREFWNLRS